LSHSPLWLVALCGTGLGQLGYWLDRKRRRIVATNLELCFPEWTAAVRRRVMRRHMRALMQSTLVSIAIAWWRTEARLAKFVRVTGAEHYEQALHQGRAVILLVPHFLGLEVAWLALSRRRPLVGMYREPRRHLFHWALHEHRTRFGGIAVERAAGLRPLIRHMQAGRPFYYLPDLDPGRTPHVFVPFFGVPAATLTAASRFARLTGAAVVPCIARQRRFGRGFNIRLLPAIEQFPGADETADSARLNRLIEAEVRESPEQYFWVHRRFKTRPPGAPPLYR
jgi:KDO2-lipid IV(A) lauroyltransferase